MKNVFKGINEIPVKTWSWLSVNDTELKEGFPSFTAYGKNPLTGSVPEGVEVLLMEPLKAYFEKYKLEPKVKEAFQTYMQENRNSGYVIRITKGQTIETPIFLSYELDESSPVLVDNVCILAEENSRATVIIRYSPAGPLALSHSGLTQVYAQNGAELNLIKVQMLADQDKHVDHVAGAAEAKAKVKVVLAELGAKQSITNCNIDLRGENSEARIDSIYLGDKERTLDINYRIAHLGKNTVSEIHSRGVLADRSEKVFRGTIDFVSGASGSRGKEEEYAVLFSPFVKNVSAPLLLCGEDVVEGAHAASTGKLEESKLFYLMTRGFSETDAKKIILEASFTPVLQKITDESLKEQIFSYIKERLSYV